MSRVIRICVVARALVVALTIPMTRITDWVARWQGWYGTVGGAVL